MVWSTCVPSERGWECADRLNAAARMVQAKWRQSRGQGAENVLRSLPCGCHPRRMSWMKFDHELARIVTLIRGARKPAELALDASAAAELAAVVRRVPLRYLAANFDSGVLASWEGPRVTDWWLSFLGARAGGPDGWAVLAVSSLDSSGFAREAAVRLLGESPSLEALPFVVLRTSDWVSSVRSQAQRALQHHLESCSDQDLLPALEVALQIEANPYGPRTWGARSVRERLSGSAGELLIQAVEQGGPMSANWAIDQLSKRQSPALAGTIRIALGSNVVQVRVAAARAIAGVQTPERGALIEQILSDRLGFVRRTALEAVLEEIPVEILERALRDPARSIRNLVIFELRRRDPAYSASAFYRGLVTSTRAEDRVLGLSGLADVGRSEDAVEAVCLVDDKSPKVRVAALRCLGKLSPAEGAEAGLIALRDESTKVVATAAAIASRKPSLRLETAAEEMIRDRQPQRFRAGLRLLAVSRFEQQVEMLSSLLEEPNRQDEALASLDKCLRNGLVGGRILPQALVQRLVGALTRPATSTDQGSAHMASKRQQRILFALRTAADSIT